MFWILSSLSIRLSTIYLDSYQFVPNDICNGFLSSTSSLDSESESENGDDIDLDKCLEKETEEERDKNL